MRQFIYKIHYFATALLMEQLSEAMLRLMKHFYIEVFWYNLKLICFQIFIVSLNIKLKNLFDNKEQNEADHTRN